MKTYTQSTSHFTEKDLTPKTEVFEPLEFMLERIERIKPETPVRDKINQGMSLEDAIQSEVVKVASITISQQEYDRLLAIEAEVKKLVPLIERML